ncbi:MAG: hypothetical protein IJJ23_02090 [Clostridia bacterium]|nr:hypothetical protein [Clostridia bacterium]
MAKLHFDRDDLDKNKLTAALGCVIFPIPLLACPDSRLGKHCANQGLLALIAYLAAALAFGIVLAILGWVPLLGTILRVARFAALALVTVCAFLNAYRTWQGQPDQLPYIGGITIIK